MAHFWRDNNQEPLFPWHGPTLFGSGKYVGASVTESDNTMFLDGPVKNLEVLAVTEQGDLEQWWRENGGAYLWHRSRIVRQHCCGAPSIVYPGAFFLEDSETGIDFKSHLKADMLMACGLSAGNLKFGFDLADHVDPDFFITEPDLVHPPPNMLRDFSYTGVCIAMTDVKNLAMNEAGWKNCNEAVLGNPVNWIFVAGISTDGAMQVHLSDLQAAFVGGGIQRAFTGGVSITVPQEDGSHELRPFKGRPCIFQSDHDLDEGGVINAHYGNLELFGPGKHGGIYHLWRNNGMARVVGDNPLNSLEAGWRFAGKIGTAMYDEVSVIQSNFGTAPNGNFEMVARRLDQTGFDFFFRNEELVWNGPNVVTGVTLGTVAQPLAIEDLFARLVNVNVDFSVPESDLRDFLSNAEFTPYPSIAEVLISRMRGRRFKEAIFIDVIVFNYEERAASPRSIADVDIAILEAAALEGFNLRYDVNELTFDGLLR